MHFPEELEYLRRFNEFLNDPESLCKTEPYEAEHLFGMPIDGWWWTATRRKPCISWENRCCERNGRSNMGHWMEPWDATPATVLAPAHRRKWPVTPKVWRDIEVPYRLLLNRRWSCAPTGCS